MKFTSRTKGFTRINQITNEGIRSELGIYNLNEKTNEYCQGRRQHMERMSIQRIPKQEHWYVAGGKREDPREDERTKMKLEDIREDEDRNFVEFEQATPNP